jgi:hypothetical protein
MSEFAFILRVINDTIEEVNAVCKHKEPRFEETLCALSCY